MQRLAPIDRILLAILIPLCLIVVGLHVWSVVTRDLASNAIYAAPAAGPDAYPTVGGFYPESHEVGIELQRGDRLLRVGDYDLKGVGYTRFDGLVLERTSPTRWVEIEFERGGVVAVAEIRAIPYPMPWHRMPMMISLFGVGVIVMFRGRDRRQARLVFAGFISSHDHSRAISRRPVVDHGTGLADSLYRRAGRLRSYDRRHDDCARSTRTTHEMGHRSVPGMRPLQSADAIELLLRVPAVFLDGAAWSLALGRHVYRSRSVCSPLASLSGRNTDRLHARRGTDDRGFDHSSDRAGFAPGGPAPCRRLFRARPDSHRLVEPNRDAWSIRRRSSPQRSGHLHPSGHPSPSAHFLG